MFKYVDICLYIYICLYLPIYVNLNIYVNLWFLMNIYVNTCKYKYMYTQINVFECKYL